MNFESPTSNTNKSYNYNKDQNNSFLDLTKFTYQSSKYKSRSKSPNSVAVTSPDSQIHSYTRQGWNKRPDYDYQISHQQSPQSHIKTPSFSGIEINRKDFESKNNMDREKSSFDNQNNIQNDRSKTNKQQNERYENRPNGVSNDHKHIQEVDGDLEFSDTLMNSDSKYFQKKMNLKKENDYNYESLYPSSSLYKYQEKSTAVTHEMSHKNHSNQYRNDDYRKKVKTSKFDENYEVSQEKLIDSGFKLEKNTNEDMSCNEYQKRLRFQDENFFNSIVEIPEPYF